MFRTLSTALALTGLVTLSSGAALADPTAIPVAELGACKVLHATECPALKKLVDGGPANEKLALSMLGHADRKVRRAGARFFVRHPSPSAGPALTALVGDGDPNVRNAGLDAIGLCGRPAQSKIILAQLAQETEQGPKVAALRALGRLEAKDAVPTLVTALDDASPHAALAATEGLGRIGVPEAVTPLAAVIANPKAAAELRREAALSLLRIGDARAVPILMHAVFDPAYEVQRAAVRALGGLRAEPAIDLLIELLANDALLLDAVQALGNFDNPRTLDPMYTILRADDLPVEIRSAALESLGRHRITSAVPELLSMLRKPDSELTLHVIRALGAMKDERALSRLIEMLNSKDAAVVSAANSALASITGKAIDPNPEYWNKWLTERNSEDAPIPNPALNP